jgi:hypothetical protein
MNRRFVLAASVAGAIVLFWPAVARARRPNPRPGPCPKAPVPRSPEEWAHQREGQLALRLRGFRQAPRNSSPPREADPGGDEALVAGPNHEMGRELLWPEFPTDQRGSYVCQFWDPRGS